MKYTKILKVLCVVALVIASVPPLKSVAGAAATTTATRSTAVVAGTAAAATAPAAGAVAGGLPATFADYKKAHVADINFDTLEADLQNATALGDFNARMDRLKKALAPDVIAKYKNDADFKKMTGGAFKKAMRASRRMMTSDKATDQNVVRQAINDTFNAGKASVLADVKQSDVDAALTKWTDYQSKNLVLFRDAAKLQSDITALAAVLADSETVAAYGDTLAQAIAGQAGLMNAAQFSGKASNLAALFDKADANRKKTLKPMILDIFAKYVDAANAPLAAYKSNLSGLRTSVTNAK